MRMRWTKLLSIKINMVPQLTMIIRDLLAPRPDVRTSGTCGGGGPGPKSLEEPYPEVISCRSREQEVRSSADSELFLPFAPREEL